MNVLIISALVFVGGGLGSLSRFALSKLGQQVMTTKFPLGTLLVNILACTLLGFIIYYSKAKINTNIFIKYFLVIGFCGGFSTFSTFGMETINLFKQNLILYGFANILISISVGFAILWVLIKS